MTALIIELMPPMHLDAGMNNSNSIVLSMTRFEMTRSGRMSSTRKTFLISKI